MKKATKKRAKKPSPKRQQMIVLVDAAGNYYEIPRATVQRGKVSEPRKKEVAEALEDVDARYTYIRASAIPGSTASPKFVGGTELNYAGFYIRSAEPKR
jgi:hypothetical protein